jgi:cobalamin biosynthesis protein CobD/CbiB
VPSSKPNTEHKTQKTKTTLQLVWGVLLVLAGIGVMFRIPQVMPQIRQIEYFSGVLPFIYFCFYFMAVLLIAGGAKKIYDNYKKVNRGKDK